MDPLKGLPLLEKKDILRRIALEAGWAQSAPDDVRQGAMHAVAEARGGAYLSPSWPGTHRNARWRCQLGDEWDATPSNVMYSGSWCPICAKRNKRRLPLTPEQVRGRHNSAAIKSRARHRLQAFGALFEQVSGSLGLVQEDREEATWIFDAILESGVVRGRSLRVFSAVAILLSAQNHGRVVSFGQVAKATRLTRKQLFRPYQMAKEIIGAEAGNPQAILPLSAYITKLAADLELPEVFSSAAICLTEEYNAVGKNPWIVAAAAVWLVSRGLLSQKTIAAAAGTTVATLRIRAKELKKYLVE